MNRDKDKSLSCYRFSQPHAGSQQLRSTKKRAVLGHCHALTLQQREDLVVSQGWVKTTAERDRDYGPLQSTVHTDTLLNKASP